MTDTQELMFRFLGVIAAASLTTMNLVIASTLTGYKRRELLDYSERLSDECRAITEELGEGEE